MWDISRHQGCKDRPMSPLRYSWSPRCRQDWRGAVMLGALVAVTVLVSAPHSTAAGPLSSNAVKELRQALLLPVLNIEPNSLDLESRWRNLQRMVAGLHRVQDLREALLLPEWRDEDLDEPIAAVDR